MEERLNIVAVASMVESNHGGIEVANVTDESLWWRRNWGDDAITEWEEADIDYSPVDNDEEQFLDDEGIPVSKPYFTIGNVDDKGNEWKYFLDDFLVIRR